jgi:hypothetical protein
MKRRNIMAMLTAQLVIVTCILPPLVDDAGQPTNKLPAILCRWDRKVELPAKVLEKMKDLEIVGTPSVTMTPSSDPRTISKLLYIASKMESGKRFVVPVDVEENDIDIVGKSSFYIRVRPERVHLDKLTEAEPVWAVGDVEATDAGTALAAHYREVSKAMNIARAAKTSPSGAPAGAPGDTPVPAEEIPF